MASGGQAIKEQHWDTSKSPKHIQLGVLDIGRKETSDKTYLEALIHDNCMVTVDVGDVPWCAYWLGADLEKSGTKSTRKGNARSYLEWGNPVPQGQWKEGDVVVFWRGKRDDGVTGHVAFLLAWDDDYVYCLGGNQGDKVSIQKFERSKIIGVRRWASSWSWTDVTVVSTKLGVGADQLIEGSLKAADQAENAQTLLQEMVKYLPNFQQSIGLLLLVLGTIVIINKIRKS